MARKAMPRTTRSSVALPPVVGSEPGRADEGNPACEDEVLPRPKDVVLVDSHDPAVLPSWQSTTAEVSL